MAPVQQFATSGVRALVEIAWMARREASTGDRAHAASFDEANWLLHRLARSLHIPVGHPDQTANRTYDETGIHEESSFYADGTDPSFAPSPERAAELSALSAEDAVQLIVDVIHPLAHRYVDGRATYAPGMFNDATRTLRKAGFSMAATEAMGKSAWVTDGWGDSFLSLSHAEREERDRARAGLPETTSF